MEEWKQIPELPKYEASSLGRIRGPRGLLSCFVRENGYAFCQAGGRQWRVARLICSAFHGPCPSKFHQAAHLNGQRSDNRKDNLAWKTGYENSKDKISHGTLLAKDNHPRAKLTQADVVSIRERRKSGETIKAIHKDYPDCCYATISHAVNGRNWK